MKTFAVICGIFAIICIVVFIAGFLFYKRFLKNTTCEICGGELIQSHKLKPNGDPYKYCIACGLLFE